MAESFYDRLSFEDYVKLEFRRAVYHFGKLPWFSTPEILSLLQRVVPRPVARRLLKSPEEYLQQEAFMIIGVGQK